MCGPDATTTRRLSMLTLISGEPSADGGLVPGRPHPGSEAHRLLRNRSDSLVGGPSLCSNSALHPLILPSGDPSDHKSISDQRGDWYAQTRLDDCCSHWTTVGAFTRGGGAGPFPRWGLDETNVAGLGGGVASAVRVAGAPAGRLGDGPGHAAGGSALMVKNTTDEGEN